MAINNPLKNEKKLSEFIIVQNEKYWGRTCMLLSAFSAWSKTDVNPFTMTKDQLMAFGKFLVNVKRPTVKSKTWMNYRYSVLACLQDNDFDALVNVRSGVPSKEIAQRTSAKRSNKFNTEMMEKFHKKILASKSSYRTITYNWVKSTSLTGLRPREWINTSIEYLFDGLAFLKVNTITKGIPLIEWNPVRYVPIYHLDNYDQDIIRSHLNSVKMYANNDAYDKLYFSCRMLLQKYTAILFGDEKSVSLYSCRQQFAANLKFNKISKECIMIVMGHTSETTQRHHYAPEYHGESISFPEKMTLNANGKAA